MLTYLPMILSIVQVLFVALVSALYRQHQKAKDTQDQRIDKQDREIDKLRDEVHEQDMKLARVDGYMQRSSEDSKELRAEMTNLRNRMDGLAATVLTKDDLKTVSAALVLAVKTGDHSVLG